MLFFLKATIMDGIDEAYSNEICLHRKLAPFQCSIFSISHTSQNDIELMDLATYILLKLKQAGIDVLQQTESIVRNTDGLTEKFNAVDQIGVPYTIVLNDESLKNGLMQLRNRDTTISETIHLTDVPAYFLKIFN